MELALQRTVGVAIIDVGTDIVILFKLADRARFLKVWWLLSLDWLL